MLRMFCCWFLAFFFSGYFVTDILKLMNAKKKRYWIVFFDIILDIFAIFAFIFIANGGF